MLESDESKKYDIIAENWGMSVGIARITIIIFRETEKPLGVHRTHVGWGYPRVQWIWTGEIAKPPLYDEQLSDNDALSSVQLSSSNFKDRVVGVRIDTGAKPIIIK